MPKSQFEHLRTAVETDRKAREEASRLEALTTALANATLDLQALQAAFEEAAARAERAEREARSLRRDLAEAAASRNDEVMRQVRAVAKGMKLDGLRPERAETFGEITETLRGNPGAQQLARQIVNAGRKAQGKPGVFIAREGTSPEHAAFALQVANAQRMAKGLPLLKAAADDQPVDEDDDKPPGKGKKKKLPVKADDEDADPAAEDDEDAIDGTKDPKAFARAVAAASKKVWGR